MSDEEGTQRSGTPRENAALSCAACGSENPARFRFCGSCGSPLDKRTEPATGPEHAASRPQPERRQLTVLFCDLVGSSHLATRLDPEKLHELMKSYQSVCTAPIRRFDGTVSRYVGDGIFALFGYPHAHEDDPERAIRAGLQIIGEISRLELPDDLVGVDGLAVRIGVATGLVVVGDLIGEGAAEKEAVVGETPNLASRMQALAAGNTLVIAPGTRALIGDRFHCEDLGPQEAAGFPQPVRAWRVLRARSVESRFEAGQPVRLAPIVDREEYTRWLRELWHRAEHNQGAVALLSGEAGIGKSRIVEALREQIAGTPYAALRFQCSPHFTNTALHPIIEYIERAAGIQREGSATTKLDQLETWLRGGPESSIAIPLLAALLSIPSDERWPLPAMTARRQKELTFEVLLQYIARLATVWPLPIVFEDVHWIDPTTREFLSLLIERVPNMRALVVVTFRPEFVPPWLNEPHVEFREIEKLPAEHAHGLARRIAGDRLAAAAISEVVAKTDGVPLFIEEITKAVLDTALPTEQSNGGNAAFFAIPSSLQDSLMARLDQLGAAKTVAQIAGAIGREFTYELLASVIPLDDARLREELSVLEESGLVQREHRFDAECYVFKHALVQEAAYHSLLRSRRRELHMRIAEALESRFPQTTRHAPELIAHHWTAAGISERAVAAWLRAGEHSSQRSEYREAAAHLRKGLMLVPQLKNAETRRKYELALLLALGPVLITTEGGGTAEVSTLYERALELCSDVPDSASHFVAQWGWWRTSMNHRTGRERADKLLELAQRSEEPQLIVQAHHCQWATLYMLGEHRECCDHIAAGLKLYEPVRDRTHAILYGGHDARVCGLGEAALARWLMGYLDAAGESAGGALAWADELAHVGSRAHAMDYSLVLHKFRRDMRAVHGRANELLAFASEQKLQVHQAKARCFRGWADVLATRHITALAEVRGAIESMQGTDTPTDFPLYYEMLAEACGRMGRTEDGLRAVDQALAIADQQGIVFWNAELYRRRGELLAQAGDDEGAAASLEQALACAASSAARTLQLRAAIALARLYRRDERRVAALDTVRQLHATFTEGFDTPDLTDARQLLEAYR